LTPENVADAIAEVGPWGIDVAGGVESSPGVKDAARIQTFLERARA
jgi:phosphoribosylanthranilate isomerase